MGHGKARAKAAGEKIGVPLGVYCLSRIIKNQPSRLLFVNIRQCTLEFQGAGLVPSLLRDTWQTKKDPKSCSRVRDFFGRGSLNFGSFWRLRFSF